MPTDATDATVCRAQDRTEISMQTLDREVPSALLAGVADLYVIESGEEISLSRDTNGLIVVDDQMLSFDNEGDFVPFPNPPGEYQVWTTRQPQIMVVACEP